MEVLLSRIRSRTQPDHRNKPIMMLVTGKRLVKRMGDALLRVRMNSFELEQVDVFNLLGLRIDSLLTFDQHVEKLCEKVAANWCA